MDICEACDTDVTSITMSTEQAILPIRLLRLNQKAFTTRLKAIRVGYQTLCGSNFSTKIRKMIMVDEECVRIGVLIFNDDIARFAEKITVNKTYLITDAIVKQVNQMYPNAHCEKELVLTKHTLIEEVDDNIGDTICYSFVPFREIEPDQHRSAGVDACGIVIKVKESRVTTNRKSALISLREITIINSDYIPIVICLWDDMATNEGGTLQAMADQYPIIAVSRVIGKKYLGELQLQTTAASILQINPKNDEIGSLRKWLKSMKDLSKLPELASSERINAAREVTLHQIIQDRNEFPNDTYYYFKAKVDSVEHKSSIWYDACKKCSASVWVNEGKATCRKCNAEDIETVPRYRLMVNVVQGKDTGTVTMFEDVAAVFVGCPVTEYIASIEKGEHKSKYFRGLSLKTSTEYRFLFVLTHNAQLNNGKFQVVAEAIDRLPPESMRRRKRIASAVSERLEVAANSQSHGKQQSDGSVLHGTVDTTKEHHVVSQEDDNQINSLERGVNGVSHGIQISSDDDATLSTFKKKQCTKGNKRGGKKKSTGRKIKSEQS